MKRTIGQCPEGNSMKDVFKALILALLLTACGTEAGKFTVPANTEIGAKVSSDAGKTGPGRPGEFHHETPTDPY